MNGQAVTLINEVQGHIVVSKTSRKKPVRAPRVVGELAYLPLTKGYEAVVNASDLALLGSRPWCALVHKNTVYAVRNDVVDGRRVTVYLHRVVLSAPDELLVDHKDGNGLNNTRANLRLATRTQNCQNQRVGRRNTSGVKGVSWDQSKNKWQVGIGIAGKRKHIGRFDSLSDAEAAYARAIALEYGEFGLAAKSEAHHD